MENNINVLGNAGAGFIGSIHNFENFIISNEKKF